VAELISVLLAVHCASLEEDLTDEVL